MITMVIADDEEMIRDGLHTIVDWAEFGIEVVGLAEDGKEAFDICMSLEPDILCTDIRMPIMDGLELSQKLREAGNTTKIVFISGVQDFHYAKTALSMHAEAYVLKPVKLHELKEVFGQVAAKIVRERDSEELNSKLHKQLKDSIPALREKLLIQLLSRYYSNEMEIYEKIGYYQIPLYKGEATAIGLLQIDDYENALAHYNEENKQLLFFAIHNVIQEIMTNAASGFAFTNIMENELILIFNEKSLLGHKYIDLAEEIVRCVRQYVKVSASIGIGSSVSSVLQLSVSYQEAKEALQHTFFTGKESVVTIHDIAHNKGESERHLQLHELEKQLTQQLKLGDAQGVTTLMNKLFDEVILPNSTQVEHVYHHSAELVFQLARPLQEADESYQSILGKSTSDLLQIIQTKKDIDSLRSYMTSFIEEIALYLKNKHHSKNQRVIARIKQYINQHYMNNVTIQLLAEEVFLSPTYMCQIFKQETDETIIEFLTKVRIEKAKDLLKSPDLKIFVIAEMVGFENATYFTTVFKKLTGVIPGKYRESL
ncbi:response regulator transcription factor [Paenibacillus qinlingensis]|uniref:response regulator transcription factor n=1 Tax=Paenibacillus qinlingensis TaxID=1837343 RepID=UPI001564FD77|nr:response regulator [Paenibacillus qinlingensis]NQX60758.1 response regulator [Paenibacillus qinlingensis]